MLHLLFQLTAVALLLLTLPGTFELALLTFAALLPARSEDTRARVSIASMALVIPAHNEAATITKAVISAAACVIPDDLKFAIVVVADNCTDATAALAESAGARVLTRRDETRRGKGFALNFAFAQLLAEGFDAVMVMDADSVIDPDSVVEVARLLREDADGVQVRDLVDNAADSMRLRLLNVAFLACNLLRPRGRDRLGLSAGIFGNGFALSRATLQAVPYNAASIVEDLEYHLLLVRAGRRVRFTENAAVRATMPSGGGAAQTQRARWEGGRLRMAAQHLPGLATAVVHRSWRQLEPMLELALLPLAFHTAALALALILAHGALHFFTEISLVVVAAHVALAIVIGGGGFSDFAALAGAPFYILWKLMLTPAILRSSRLGAAWVRTARE